MLVAFTAFCTLPNTYFNIAPAFTLLGSIPKIFWKIVFISFAEAIFTGGLFGRFGGGKGLGCVGGMFVLTGEFLSDEVDVAPAAKVKLFTKFTSELKSVIN